MPLIAGHTFQDTAVGRVCPCGIRWLHIISATREDIGQTGWAHTGAMNEREFGEIRAELDRISSHVSDIGSAARAS